MDQIQREKVIDKLVKIKALAERGVGGEKTTALLMYDSLKTRYNISDEEVQMAAAEPPDISEIDLKQYGGLVMALGIIGTNLQEELDICNECPHTHTEENCCGCSTHENIKDLQLQFEEMKKQLQKAAMEV